MALHNNYECSSEGAVRHWEIPYARLEDVTPTETDPAAVLSLLPGTQLTGTVLTIDATRSVAVIDFTCSMVYYQPVRNTLTYNVGAANTWGPINIGDPIYYDRSAALLAIDVRLSTSPADSAAGANALFGFAVARDEVDQALFPKGGVTASTQWVAVMQLGAGAH